MNWPTPTPTHSWTNKLSHTSRVAAGKEKNSSFHRNLLHSIVKMKSPVMLPLLLSLCGVSQAFVTPKSYPLPFQFSLSSHHDNDDCDPHHSHVPFIPSEMRRSTLQLIASLPLAAAMPSHAFDTVLSVPTQTKETTWPLGKVAFSLLPLAGSYSRRATGERKVAILLSCLVCQWCQL